MSQLPVYVDIDGTLTDADTANAKPLMRRIDAVRIMIRNGKPVVIWSARGTEYAREFCRRHALNPMAVLGKPLYCIDDNPRVRPDGLDVRYPDMLDA